MWMLEKMGKINIRIENICVQSFVEWDIGKKCCNKIAY